MDSNQAASVADAFERALGEILARVSVSGSAIGIAYSGGLDSSVLLRLAADWAKTSNTTLFAFHVHHGLSPHAEQWLQHCEAEATMAGIRFDVRRIAVDVAAGHGVEQAARLGRYAALGQMCRAHGVRLLLTAHHQDDQAETVLLQLLRGSGVAGLAGMELCNSAPGLLGDAVLRIGRPLLGLRRAELEAYAHARSVRHVDDESNLDRRYARNALRHEIFPILRRHFPGFEERLARSARHARAADSLLDEMARADLGTVSDGRSIDIAALRMFDGNRANNLLRHWFGLHGARMPSTAWLAQMRTQVLAARDDARVRVIHDDFEIHRYRGRIFLTPGREGSMAAPMQFRWNGESSVAFPTFGGRLRFVEADVGISPAWLRQQLLQLSHRTGGERLKPAPNRPTRSLKQHFQSLDIPEWERRRLPLLSAADQLLFAAGIGLNWLAPVERAPGSISIMWEADTENVTPPSEMQG